MAEGTEFEALVARFYEPLYRFAFSLTRNEPDACDLTQQTFCIWAAKGSQLRDPTKVKTWLFTTLHREFLGSRRRETRFPHIQWEGAEQEIPVRPAPAFFDLDGARVIEALGELEEPYQAPVALFYLEDYSYNEIAEILGIPLGTVKSRLARALARLHQSLSTPRPRPPGL